MVYIIVLNYGNNDINDKIGYIPRWGGQLRNIGNIILFSNLALCTHHMSQLTDQIFAQKASFYIRDDNQL